jgi:hypothetical protein
VSYGYPAGTCDFAGTCDPAPASQQEPANSQEPVIPRYLKSRNLRTRRLRSRKNPHARTFDRIGHGQASLWNVALATTLSVAKRPVGSIPAAAHIPSDPRASMAKPLRLAAAAFSLACRSRKQRVAAAHIPCSPRVRNNRFAITSSPKLATSSARRQNPAASPSDPSALLVLFW